MMLNLLTKSELRDLTLMEGISIASRERVTALLSWRTLPQGEGRVQDVVAVCLDENMASFAILSIAEALRDRAALCDLRQYCRPPTSAEVNLFLNAFDAEGNPKKEPSDPQDERSQPMARRFSEDFAVGEEFSDENEP
jgi:hypothetical protein